MNDEKSCGERKSRERMLRVQTGANGRSEITDNGFRDSKQSQRNGGAAEAVLQQADGCSQQKTRGRVASAQAKINRYKQGQIEESHPREMQRKPGLHHQREQRGNKDR